MTVPLPAVSRRRAHLAIAFALLLATPLLTPTRSRVAAQASGAAGHTPVQEALRIRLETAADLRRLTVDGEVIHAAQRLLSYYARRGFEPVWVDESGPRPAMRELLDALHGADADGLLPADYHAPPLSRALEARSGEAPVPARLVDIELLASDGFLVLASHLLAGRVDPRSLAATWFTERPRADLLALLDRATSTGRVRAALGEVSPRDPAYHTLKLALARYRAIAAAGGWPRVPTGSTLRVGDEDPRIPLLRRRLQASGDLPTAQAALDIDPAADSSQRFDPDLQRAVARFQWRHGLEVDSAVGPATLRALNVAAAQRVEQVRLNLERWRWLPPYLGDRYIVVNIPAFKTWVVDSGRIVLSMRSIVGRPYRDTPIFTDTMTYVVMSPYWNVPPNLAVKDLLPRIKRDPGYLDRQGIKVFRGNGTTPVDPATIDWRSLSASNFPYRLRQDPGPKNAMGRVKFMFPNQFNVYMHDTPDRELFDQASRSFSSGCVRLEKPLELAEFVLRANGGWDRAAIEAATSQPVERTVRLAQPIPVHLLYWTAWADVDGTTHFREDIYGRDAPLARALATPTPR